MRIGNARAFVLFEVVLAVAIFALGILAIAKSANGCFDAQIAVAQTQRARLALENRMAQVLAGEAKVGDEREEGLKGIFEGIRMRQKREPANLVNEDREKLDGLSEITLTASWGEGASAQSYRIVFYMLDTP